MFTILIIVFAILVTGALAYLIANKVPKKIRPIISIILWLLVVFLGYKIYQGIMDPIKFNAEKKERYSKVIDNLKIIRDAEIVHKEVTGDFTNKPNDLITFIDTAKKAITETKNIIKTVNKGTSYSPIMIEVEERVVDTIGYTDVRADFAGRDYKNMFKVPGTDAQFELKTSYVEKVQGIKSPVFIAQVDKAIVLDGLSKQLIRQEKEALAPEVTGEYVSVGSLEDVKTNGNWPIIYDTGEIKNKK
jgi:hypothetical protein